MSGPPGSALYVTRFILMPGASLDSQTIVGGEVLIVGMNKGEVINEKRSRSSHISVFDGWVVLMPKEEPYLLRNVGKAPLDLLVIEVRKAMQACDATPQLCEQLRQALQNKRPSK